MYSPPLSPFQLQVVERCEEHEKNEYSKPISRRSTRFVVVGQCFIKYDTHIPLYYQYLTQKYVYDKTVGDANAPRVAKVYDYFTQFSPRMGVRMAYLVMEHIDADPTPPSTAPEKVAEALQWLHRLPLPVDAAIGSIGGGVAHHRVFHDDVAPLHFSSIEALQRYINKVCPSSAVINRWQLIVVWYKSFHWLSGGRTEKEIDLSNERLVFTQSNPHEMNFLIDKDGKICLVDFDTVVLLPESFASYTMHINTDPFVQEVAKFLDWPRSPNYRSMSVARSLLVMIADPTLGAPISAYYKILTHILMYDGDRLGQGRPARLQAQENGAGRHDLRRCGPTLCIIYWIPT